MKRKFCDRCGKEIEEQAFGMQYVSKPYAIFRQGPLSFPVTPVAPPFMPDEVDLCSKCMGDFEEFMKGKEA